MKAEGRVGDGESSLENWRVVSVALAGSWKSRETKVDVQDSTRSMAVVGASDPDIVQIALGCFACVDERDLYRRIAVTYGKQLSS